jgi:hypothetical protein
MRDHAELPQFIPPSTRAADPQPNNVSSAEPWLSPRAHTLVKVVPPRALSADPADGERAPAERVTEEKAQR